MTNVQYTFDYVKWTVHGGIYYSCEMIERLYLYFVQCQKQITTTHFGRRKSQGQTERELFEEVRREIRFPMLQFI